MIVNEEGSVSNIEWEFKGIHYKIISSESKGRSVWETIDTAKRQDGFIKKFTRKQLKNYFNN